MHVSNLIDLKGQFRAAKSSKHASIGKIRALRGKLFGTEISHGSLKVYTVQQFSIFWFFSLHLYRDAEPFFYYNL